MNRTHQNGYVVLITTIIIGAACTATALALLSGGADNQRAARVNEQALQARQLAHACAEEALQKLNEASSFTGTGNLTIGQGTCTYTVTDASGTRTIAAIGTVGNIVKKVKVFATINLSNISVTSWQEVGDI